MADQWIFSEFLQDTGKLGYCFDLSTKVQESGDQVLQLSEKKNVV